MIPLYACQAGGGGIYTVDDPSVFADGAALNGTGGSAYSPTLRTGPIRAGTLGFGRMRRLVQRVLHDSNVVVTLMVVADGTEGVPLARGLRPQDPAQIVVPTAAAGDEFQFDITLSDFDAVCALSDGVFFAIPRQGR